MKIAIAQMDLAWRDEAANLRKVEQLAQQAHEADLLVLPEMFTTGFCMDAAELATTMGGAVIQQLKEISKRYDLALYGSLIIEEDNRHYNRGLFITPDGDVRTYDKHHLFSLYKVRHLQECFLFQQYQGPTHHFLLHHYKKQIDNGHLILQYHLMLTFLILDIIL